MPKNFADLNETQQKFLKKYLRGFSIKGSDREKNKTFNADFDAAVTPLYKQINRIEKTIGEIAETDERFSEEVNLNRLDTHREALKTRLNDSAKMLKKREIPDFADIGDALQTFEDVLEQRRQQGTDRQDAAALLQSEKEAHAEEVLLALQENGVLTARMFKDARAIKSLPEDVRIRETAMSVYETTLASAKTDIGALIAAQVEDTSIELAAFQSACSARKETFDRDAAAQIAVVEGIINKPAPSLEEIQSLLADNYSGLDTVQTEAARMAAIAAEHDKVTAALAAQTDKLDVLTEKMRAASPAEQKKLRGEKAALTAHINQIGMRAAQLAAFTAEQPERERFLLIAGSEAEEAARRADALENGSDQAWLDVKLAHLLEGATFADREDYDAPSELFSADEMTQKIAATRVVLSAAAARDVIIPRLTEDEPRMKELSGEELATLEKMLNAAQEFSDAGRTDLAFALHEEVLALRREFTAARNMLKLPPAAPPPPSPAQKLLDQIKIIIGDLGDLWGQGCEAAQDLIAEGNALIAAVKTSDEAHAFTDDPGLHEDQVKSLRDRMEALDPPPAESAELTRAKEIATSNAEIIDGWLDKLIKTEKISDKDIIEVPGQTYSKSERKRLVHPDEILTVRNGAGEIEKHRMVMTRKGKGGEDSAKHSSSAGKVTPMEVLQGLHTRSETLRMMIASGTPGSEEAIKDYSNATKDLIEDVQKNGLRIYPAIKEILKACDKVLTKGSMAEFLPENVGDVKNRYQAFKDSYLDKKPTDAEIDAIALKAEIDALEELADKTVKPAYHAQRTVYGKIIKDLKGAKDKSADAIAVGKMMEKVLKSEVGELFAGSSDGADDETSKKLVQARERFVAVKKFYTSNAKILSSREMSGPWLTRTETAYKKLSSKVGTNITEAAEEFQTIKDEMRAFFDQMSDLESASGPDQATKLIELCNMLHLSAKTASDDHEARRLYLVKSAELKAEISAQKKLVGKKGKNAIAQQLAADLDALKSRRKATKSKTEADEDYGSAMTEFEEIERELSAISEKIETTQKGGRVKASKMKINDKIPVLEQFLSRLKDTAETLADKEMRPRMSDEQTADFEPRIAIVDTSLGRISALPDLVALKKLATDIDADNASDTPSKTSRVAWRESALTEIRKLRTALDMDPAVKIYARNPFDMGTDMSLVRTALHQVEVATLACVDPKEKE
ncbi:hypothetical protein Z946_3957 [Sulfitobacter noctilucicola]|uniref:Uncharacterized protein n=1 Tax=Sulfitobacter noctilucicola TaxID=1342301 RepID=A0A7W6M7E6_9RHOB|nr:hypothetical protein [Sulfitobacter noctilucicola]KIN65059.1 hypothetical protein Z946_3957 [Sulfitobacter noctilucicola]MBB4173801.1 hypothetical protein [Sulfitobacter noctilucicola]